MLKIILTFIVAMTVTVCSGIARAIMWSTLGRIMYYIYTAAILTAFVTLIDIWI